PWARLGAAGGDGARRDALRDGSWLEEEEEEEVEEAEAVVVAEEVVAMAMHGDGGSARAGSAVAPVGQSFGLEGSEDEDGEEDGDVVVHVAPSLAGARAESALVHDDEETSEEARSSVSRTSRVNRELTGRPSIVPHTMASYRPAFLPTPEDFCPAEGWGSSPWRELGLLLGRCWAKVSFTAPTTAARVHDRIRTDLNGFSSVFWDGKPSSATRGAPGFQGYRVGRVVVGRDGTGNELFRVTYSVTLLRVDEHETVFKVRDSRVFRVVTSDETDESVRVTVHQERFNPLDQTPLHVHVPRMLFKCLLALALGPLLLVLLAAVQIPCLRGAFNAAYPFPKRSHRKMADRMATYLAVGSSGLGQILKAQTGPPMDPGAAAESARGHTGPGASHNHGTTRLEDAAELQRQVDTLQRTVRELRKQLRRPSAQCHLQADVDDNDDDEHDVDAGSTLARATDASVTQAGTEATRSSWTGGVAWEEAGDGRKPEESTAGERLAETLLLIEPIWRRSKDTRMEAMRLHQGSNASLDPMELVSRSNTLVKELQTRLDLCEQLHAASEETESSLFSLFPFSAGTFQRVASPAAHEEREGLVAPPPLAPTRLREDLMNLDVAVDVATSLLTDMARTALSQRLEVNSYVKEFLTLEKEQAASPAPRALSASAPKETEEEDFIQEHDFEEDAAEVELRRAAGPPVRPPPGRKAGTKGARAWLRLWWAIARKRQRVEREQGQASWKAGRMDTVKHLTKHLSLADMGGSDSGSYGDLWNALGPGPGTPMSKRFSDIDLLESGVARETIKDSVLSPISVKLKKLNKCHVIREDKTNFWMYCEATNAFLLSAKMVDGTIYISQYESFPNTFESEAKSLEAPARLGSGATFCNVVRLNEKTRTYTLFNRMCEGCDEVMGLHTCGAHSTLNGDRQVLAEIRHGSRAVQAGDDTWIDCNVVSVKLPIVYNDLSRDVWCNRFKRRKSLGNVPAVSSPLSNNNAKHGRSRARVDPAELSNPEPGSIAAAAAAQMQAEEESKDDRVEQEQKQQFAGSIFDADRFKNLKRANSMPVTKQDQKDQEEQKQAVRPLAGAPSGDCLLSTRTPRYDRNTGSLRMKFLNNRVRMASSKNLIFCLDKNSDLIDQNLSLSGDNNNNNNNNNNNQNGRARKAVDEDRVVLQFGKYNEERFNLDFRFPLAPVQAFGLALTLFKWQGGNDSNN
ncbi:Tubby protein-like, partial [Durusdinium trenchii]